MFFWRFVLNQRFCSYCATLRALTRSVYQRSTYISLSLSLSLSLSPRSLYSLKVEQNRFCDKAYCMYEISYVYTGIQDFSNRSFFEKVNQRSKGIFLTFQGDFRPDQRTKVLSHCSMIYTSINSDSGILKRVFGEFRPYHWHRHLSPLIIKRVSFVYAPIGSPGFFC